MSCRPLLFLRTFLGGIGEHEYELNNMKWSVASDRTRVNSITYKASSLDMPNEKPNVSLQVKALILRNSSIFEAPTLKLFTVSWKLKLSLYMYIITPLPLHTQWLKNGLEFCLLERGQARWCLLVLRRTKDSRNIKRYAPVASNQVISEVNKYTAQRTGYKQRT